jgi:hypothetical protein
MTKDPPTVDEIIQQLRELHVQEVELLEQLQDARNQERQQAIAEGRLSSAEAQRSIHPKTSNRFHYTNAKILSKDNTATATATRVHGRTTIQIGSRVEITNKVTQWLKGQSASSQDRQGVVTKLSATRVYLTTDSGIETWRAHKNLRLL